MFCTAYIGEDMAFKIQYCKIASMIVKKTYLFMDIHYKMRVIFIQLY